MPGAEIRAAHDPIEQSGSPLPQKALDIRLYIYNLMNGGWLSVRLQRVRTSLDEYREPFKGAVKTLPVVSGRGYCLQTAHLEHSGHFSREPASPSSYGVGKDCNPPTSTILYASIYIDA